MSGRRGLAQRAVRSLKVIDVYCRISVDYDGTTRSVDEQEEDLIEVIEETEHWTLGKVFKDPFKSGWNPKVIREEWNELMARLERGDSDGVIVYDLTRFTRKPHEGERLLALAEDGIVVASLTTQYNLRTADGRKQFRDAMTGAAFESDKISERSTRGKKKKAKRGKSNAGRRGFGRPGTLPVPEDFNPETDERVMAPPELVEAEQEAIRSAARRILAGEAMHTIAVEWNEAGLLTAAGGVWVGVTVKQMLSSPTLAGLASYKGEVVGELIGVEPILDRETWDDLQSLFAGRKRGRPYYYLLSAILRCGRCGAPLYGRPETSKKPYVNEDGSTSERRAYVCMVNIKTGGCGRIGIDQRFVDDRVEVLTLELLGDERHAAQVAQVAEKVSEARAALIARRNRLEEDRKGLASKTSVWGLAAVEEAMGPINESLAKLKVQLDALGLPEAGAGQGIDVLAEWEDANLAQRRAIVRRAFPFGITITPALKPGRHGVTVDRIVPNTAPAMEEEVA